MMWILRWPIVLILWVLTVMSLFPAAVVTVERTGVLIDLEAVSAELAALGAGASWVEAGLWYAAGIFFLISSVRLIRRTQGFWMWLIGFACFGARWAVTVQDQGGLTAAVQGLSLASYGDMTAASPAAQTLVLGAHLLIGLIILIIDGADRRYWDTHGA